MSLIVCEDSVQVAVEAAKRFVDAAATAIGKNSRFSVALSGGSTPKRVYERLAGDDFRDRIAWSNTHIFSAMNAAFPPTIQTATIAWLGKLCSLPLLLRSSNGDGHAWALQSYKHLIPCWSLAGNEMGSPSHSHRGFSPVMLLR